MKLYWLNHIGALGMLSGHCSLKGQREVKVDCQGIAIKVDKDLETNIKKNWIALVGRKYYIQ